MNTVVLVVVVVVQAEAAAEAAAAVDESAVRFDPRENDTERRNVVK